MKAREPRDLSQKDKKKSVGLKTTFFQGVRQQRNYNTLTVIPGN